ncbi:2-dehydro-3-deoxyphosphogluconate aldolase/(4S)-4-hydroxy-2-oxoglutarate aldolase [Amycolatopsis bartoniae]|uniref:2-dehydro-3-deoxy-phosphogluconate aldolase n=1 Tax=Amycolatopsis bartoniae TaxID=941986 RepID=A0A8H9MG36_9PSEU|nr:bifunctional 4-hydroxy-2-oxoglutarate aldolase/2-dehydro-3-deoxy-phosphogluconate aldolase [Amycolatopsis bartoniae]MBB2935581.1 2-dehydro-3-deoxyphosphogluconate aldolase/(4S)-4-hydroxy-2-oxoglutarate aldolase [Amycolatopsis bartoniae]TVT05234.1 bifunctional 4-hydroxy-2-oxoglutarate aldolase/2-dehydro-3-deoxy-phosphogluconate aldolase [Amycolatopsis bartoniae]GHF76856.1 ketohydroxyglutarate aldolase [Amycolatopsis bartoniae]
MDARELMGLGAVIPVVVLDDAERAVPLAKALLADGIRTMELTLRTPAALESIRRIAAEVPAIVIGAGTITQPRQAEEAVAAGAKFLVSPGSPASLVDALAAQGVPFLPGVSTVTEILTLLDRDITEMKFFPAEASGGAAFLRAVAGPLPQARFCPTGGISEANVADYLALSTVPCAGGTWIIPRSFR